MTTTNTRAKSVFTPDLAVGLTPLRLILSSIPLLVADLYFFGGTLLPGSHPAAPIARTTVNALPFASLLPVLFEGEFVRRIQRLVHILEDVSRNATQIQSNTRTASTDIWRHADREARWSPPRVIVQLLIPFVCLGVGLFLSNWPTFMSTSAKAGLIERYALLSLFAVWAFWILVYHNWMHTSLQIEPQVVNILQVMVEESKGQPSAGKASIDQKPSLLCRFLVRGTLAILFLMIVVESLHPQSAKLLPGNSVFGFHLEAYALGLALLSWLLITAQGWRECKTNARIKHLLATFRSLPGGA